MSDLGANANITEAEFRDVLDKVEEILRKVDTYAQSLFDRANQALVLLPAALTGNLQQSLTQLRELIARFYAELTKITLNPGWPPGLVAAANTWTSEVGGPISALVGKVGPDQMPVDLQWNGPAAEAYAATVPAQQKAMEGIQQAVSVLDGNLKKTAIGIVMMWIAALAALATFVLELAAEATAAGTIVGAPAAAAAAGASTGKVVVLISASIGAMLAYAALITDSIAAINQTIEANGPYPGGNWPRSTTALFNDGSLSDGDKTDWRVDTHD